jgi:voltage-gated potassium channel Kch
MMMAKSIGVTIIDKAPSLIERVGEFGYKVYYGDGLRIDLLRTAGAETAKVIAFCNDNEGGELSRDALSAVLESFPQAAVMVRAFDRVHLIELDGLDLAFAERELFESAVAMGKAALKAHGSPSTRSIRSIAVPVRDCERSSGRVRQEILLRTRPVLRSSARFRMRQEARPAQATDGLR